ncbi:MAG: hypothetical protein ACSHWN_04825 [Methylophilaceae bacterium]
MISLPFKLPGINWIIVALLIALSAAGYYIKIQNKTIDNKDARIEEISTKLGRWMTSAKSLEELVRKQNKSTQDRLDRAAAAQKRAVEAIKKARPIVEARQKQKNKAINAGVQLYSCDEAVERAKSDLAGSLL